jgi:hypothetical protein
MGEIKEFAQRLKSWGEEGQWPSLQASLLV